MAKYLPNGPLFFVNKRWNLLALIVLLIVVLFAVFGGAWASPAIALLGAFFGILKEYFVAVQEDLRAKGALTRDVSKAGMIFVFGSIAFVSLSTSVILGILRGPPQF